MIRHPVLSTQGLVAGYEHKTILHGIDLEIPPGQVTVIMGANACGKSTLLKCMARLVQARQGRVCLDGKPLGSMPTKVLARHLGLLPQSPQVPEGITVADLVSRGRFPYQRWMAGLDTKDYVAIESALDLMGVSAIAHARVDELSGGQRQRVWIAMALAQETDILLLDEPTTFLDIAYQIEILDCLTALNRSRGTTMVMVLHDINLSARYADHLIAMSGGRVIAQGSPQEIISEELIKATFDLDSLVAEDPVSGTPWVVPRGRYHSRINELQQTALLGSRR